MAKPSIIDQALGQHAVGGGLSGGGSIIDQAINAGSPAGGGGGNGGGLLAPVAGPAPKKSGGMFGFLHKIPGEQATVGAISTAADAAANVTQSIGTGIYDYAKSTNVVQTLKDIQPDLTIAANPSLALHPGRLIQTMGHNLNRDLFGGSPSRVGNQWSEFVRNPLDEAKQEYQTDPFVHATVQQYAPLADPGKDPVQTAIAAALLAAPALGSGVARIAYAAKLAKAAKFTDAAGETRLVVPGSEAAQVVMDAGKPLEPLTSSERLSLGSKVFNPRYSPPTTARYLKVTKGMRAEGPATEEGIVPTQEVTTLKQLQPSGSHLVRASQGIVDKALQAGLDRNVPILSKVADLRVGGTLGEGLRISQAIKDVTVSDLAHTKIDGGLSKNEGGMAIFLQANKVTPKEAIDYWTNKVAPTKDTEKLVQLAHSVDTKNILHTAPNAAGKTDVMVDAERYPMLADAAAKRSSALAERERIFVEHGIMHPTGVTTRGNAIRDMMVPGEHLVERAQGEYTSMASTEIKNPRTGIAASRVSTGVMPGAKRISAGKEFTGSSVVKGKVPANPLRDTARGLAQALRYENTVRGRLQVAREFGSDFRTSKRDILVRDGSQHPAAIPPEIESLVGRKDLRPLMSDDNEQSIKQAIQDRLSTDFVEKKDFVAGEQAPQGYKWVSQDKIPLEMRDTSISRSTGGNVVDSINSAVTDATVYFRPGHLPTRFFTNATTSLMQGSMHPIEMGKNATLAMKLTEKERRELVASQGAGGSRGVLPSNVQMALPRKGIQLLTSKGADIWHNNVDAPFRLNNVLYELRQRGIDTPEKVREALTYLKDPAASKIGAAKATQIDWAIRRSRRASIMYDGMSNVERRYLARALWFYPWTKASIRYAGHVLAEHPAKSYATIKVGQYGAQQRQQGLGDVPSYELGLAPLGKGKNGFVPTANFETFNPFGTVGTTAEQLVHPLNPDSGILSSANPTLAGLIPIAAGKGASGAVKQALSSTPEYQIIDAYLHPKGKGFFPTSNKYLFGSTAKSQVARMLGGSAVKRRVNVNQLHKDALHEKLPHHDIRIYGS